MISLCSASDGGGIRGLSELLVLEEIMKRIDVDESRESTQSKKPLKPRLPADYFDLIGATSTGG